jgi:hypothetical protein
MGHVHSDSVRAVSDSVNSTLGLQVSTGLVSTLRAAYLEYLWDVLEGRFGDPSDHDGVG